ncbi:hypothetical protein GCM10010123_25650 [Pilimelia anulata]|uniref:GmrSD restriction endonucleases C-terminal domain-containing protein n=1 Tax=Pilimelia anulata TaxID=53371 RepID=A0A8J3B5B0_9ACTN|nr:HNH endonuclease family protein [Pilimelia anulata]GGJ94722.1 hypothetical protein GCM10010123_25650 [Pilimelia anulata]
MRIGPTASALPAGVAAALTAAALALPPTAPAAAAATAATAATPGAGAAAAAGVVSPPDAYSAALRTAIADLPVAGEQRAGYQRALFPHWVDADRDGCHTRNEVLIAESITPPAVAPPCAVSGATWYSYYDDATWTVGGDVDIDHVVPLAEAWDSGAHAWTTALRREYANDLADPRSLVAVTDNVNQAKADQDPATWLPPYPPARCRYLGEFVATKVRWRLSVDPAERDALVANGDDCPNEVISTAYAY